MVIHGAHVLRATLRLQPTCPDREADRCPEVRSATQPYRSSQAAEEWILVPSRLAGHEWSGPSITSTGPSRLTGVTSATTSSRVTLPRPMYRRYHATSCWPGL